MRSYAPTSGGRFYLVVLLGIVAVVPMVAGASGGHLDAQPRLAADVVDAGAGDDPFVTRGLDARAFRAMDYAPSESRDVYRWGDGEATIDGSGEFDAVTGRRDGEPEPAVTVTDFHATVSIVPTADTPGVGEFDVGVLRTTLSVDGAGDGDADYAVTASAGVPTASTAVDVRSPGDDLAWGTHPASRPAPIHVSEFGVGFVAGGFIVALAGLRDRRLSSALGRTTGEEGATEDDGAAPESSVADAGPGVAESGPGVTGPDPDGPESDPDFVPDDYLVERMLGRNQGWLRQTAIVEATEWSKSKVSRLLSRMAEESRIVKVRVGRENIIYLKGEEPSIVSDAATSPA